MSRKADETCKIYKKIITTAGTAIIVYLVFRYVLPLIQPFLLAFLAAMLIRPPVRWMQKHLHLKESAGAVLIFLIVGMSAALLFYYGGRILIKEIQSIWAELRNWEIIRRIWDVTGMESCISYCMSHSKGMIQWCSSFFTSLIVFFIASVLAVEEMERLHQRLTVCIWYREIVDFGMFLRKICGKWLRTQGKIMLIIMAISALGLWITGFPYGLLLGILIGLVDVFPILGTGTIYIPWIVWEIFNHRTGRWISLLVIYLICYMVREVMENVLLGKCMGITAFEFLASVYVGLKLFGAAGFILGPLAALIILWVWQLPFYKENITGR